MADAAVVVVVTKWLLLLVRGSGWVVKRPETAIDYGCLKSCCIYGEGYYI